VSGARLTAADAVMLLPDTIDRDRMREAVAWLGISRRVVDVCTSVTFEPGQVTFELWALGEEEPRRVTVEARVR
jgi:hypothetical protein